MLSLNRVGGFRGSGIAWAGTDALPAELRRLVSALNAALGATGFPLDPRPFQPHITLARRCLRLPDAGTVEALAWNVDRLLLMASGLLPGGPVYRELAAWPLTGAPAPTMPAAETPDAASLPQDGTAAPG